MATLTYSVQLGWNTGPLGLFKIGSSTLDGTDVLGGYFGQTVYDDVTSVCLSVDIRRGRPDDLAQVDAGECTIVLRDSNGTYNPTNTTGALYAFLQPMRPLWVSCTGTGFVLGSAQLGETTTLGEGSADLFYGFVTSIRPDQRRDVQTTTIHAVDLFVWLNRSKPTIAALGACTTGEAIGAILDAVGWTMPSLRDLDDGDTLSDFSADGTKTALTLLAELLTAERGLVWIAGNGCVKYRHRHAIYEPPHTSAQYTLSGTMRALHPGVDLDQIRNRASVTRTGGVEQTASDQDSINSFGYGDYDAISSGYLASDADALSLAQWLVLQRKDIRPPVSNVQLDNLHGLQVLVRADLNDRLTVTESVGNTSGDYHVLGMTHRIDSAGKYHRGELLLRARGTEVLALDSPSAVIGSAVLGY